MDFSLCAPETEHNVNDGRWKTEPTFASDASLAAVMGATSFPEQPPSSGHDEQWSRLEFVLFTHRRGAQRITERYSVALRLALRASV